MASTTIPGLTQELIKHMTSEDLRALQHSLDAQKDQTNTNELNSWFYARRNQKPASSALKVFSIPELLEKILLNLEFRDIFVATMVNTNFCDTIRSSMNLDKACVLDYEPKGRSDHMRLLYQVLKPLMNQLSFEISGVRLEHTPDLPEKDVFTITLVRKYNFENDDDGDLLYYRYRSKEESWRGVKITDIPAAVHVYFDWNPAFDRNPTTSRRDICHRLLPHQATLGKLWELAVRERRVINQRPRLYRNVFKESSSGQRLKSEVTKMDKAMRRMGYAPSLRGRGEIDL